MKFNIVIGNPPYNNDIYLDFVTYSFKLVNTGICMVTPAKWQAKGGVKNENFRKEVVPYIKDLVYYVDCGDVFGIRLTGGVSYYLISLNKQETTNITTHCDRAKAFESNGTELRKLDSRVCFLNNNELYNICYKVGCFDEDFKQWYYIDKPVDDNFNIFATAINADAGGKESLHIFSNDGKIKMLPPFSICKETFFRSKDTKCFFSSPNIEEAESFISWVNTKFVRFMLLMRYCTYHNNNDESWSFVPNPDKFDHIFTDEEFYKKYKFSDKEISIIEGVIK